MRDDLRDAELIYIADRTLGGVATTVQPGGFDVGAIPQGHYPFGEPIVNHSDLPKGRILTLVARPRSMESLLQMLFFVDAYTERGYPVPNLVLPFVPGARQDRLNTTGDYLFTIKSIAKLINDRNFPSVKVYDPHSEVTSALIDRCHVVTPADLFAPGAVGNRTWAMDNYDAVISPDAGAEKRASQVATVLGVPMLHGWKKRDVSTGKLAGFGIEPIPDEIGRALIVDDICDGGGTFVGLADAIRNRTSGVVLDLYVTHGIFSKTTADLWRHFHNIITTNSIVDMEDNSALKIFDLFRYF